MVLTPTKSAHSSPSTVHRRQFISTALIAGAGATSLAGTSHAQVNTDVIPTTAELLPKPADSLAHYTELYLTRIELMILRRYFLIVGSLVCQLKTKYDKLLKDTIELEKLVPKLKVAGSASNMKEITEMARTSAIQLDELAKAGVPAIGAPEAVISFTLVSLKNSAAEWGSQDAITLTGPAVILLRSIIRQIKELEPLVKSLTDASAFLTTADNQLKSDLQAIRQKLYDAVEKLVDADAIRFPVPPPPTPIIQAPAQQLIGPISVSGLTDAAKSQIRSAIADLKELDAIKPGPAITVDVTDAALNVGAKCANTAGISQPIPQQPTLNLRELLGMVILWIDAGGLAAPPQQRCVSSSPTAFIKASFAPSMPAFGSGVWYGIRRVLHNFLPKDSWGRAVYCCYHIGPVLFNPNEQQRQAKIYEILPELIPASVANLYDSGNDYIRRTAAEQFAKIRP